jgi:uroporphyrinogen-III synthase
MRTLAAAGISCAELPLYATLAVSDDPALPAGATAVVLASPSAARSFLARPSVKARLLNDPDSLELIAGGATTARELERLGARIAAVAETPAPVDVLAALRLLGNNGNHGNVAAPENRALPRETSR